MSEVKDLADGKLLWQIIYLRSECTSTILTGKRTQQMGRQVVGYHSTNTCLSHQVLGYRSTNTCSSHQVLGYRSTTHVKANQVLGYHSTCMP